MKKITIFIAAVIICLGMCLGVLCACDDQTVTVSVYYCYCYFNGETYVPYDKTDYVYTLKSGAKFTFQEFYDTTVDKRLLDDALYLGFYTDSGCAYKYNESLAIREDTVLYYTKVRKQHNIIFFSYKGVTYPALIKDTQATLSGEMFTNSYGKKINTSKLKFYADEACTKEINLSSLSFETLTVDREFFGTWKTVYVKKKLL